MQISGRLVSTAVLVSLIISFSHGWAEKCDPCCAGVNKLTYQASLGTVGIKISQLTKQFPPYLTFGLDACLEVGHQAFNLDVNAILVASDGLNACKDEIEPVLVEIIKKQPDYPQNGLAVAALLTLIDVQNSCQTIISADPIPQACLNAIEPSLTNFNALKEGLIPLLNLPTGLELNPLAKGMYTNTLDMIAGLNHLKVFAEAIPDQNSPSAALNAYFLSLNLIGYPNGLSIQIRDELQNMIDVYNSGYLDNRYGNYYEVSRAWSLNRPIYSLLAGIISAANSVTNCDGDYRAILLAEPIVSQRFLTKCCINCKNKCL